VKVSINAFDREAVLAQRGQVGPAGEEDDLVAPTRE